MIKTRTEAAFDELVFTDIRPLIKNRGFKKQRNNYKFYDQSGWGKIVNFQKSQWGGKDNISFTINTGLYLPQTERFHCNKEGREKFVEASSVVRKRIGKFIPGNKKDLWFDLKPDTNTKQLFNEIRKLIEKYLIPFLDSIQSKQDILTILINGHRSDYMPAQILTLYVNGYKAAARQLLTEELTGAGKRPPIYLEWLRNAAQQMVG